MNWDFTLEEWSWKECFFCFSVVSVPEGLGMTGFQCIPVLFHHLVCCHSAECCGGPEMTCFLLFFISKSISSVQASLESLQLEC